MNEMLRTKKISSQLRQSSAGGLRNSLRESAFPRVITLSLILLSLFLSVVAAPASAEVWDMLSDREKTQLHHILDTLEPMMTEKQKDGTAPMLTFDELYGPFSTEHRDFMDRILIIDAQKDFNFQGAYLGALGIPERILERTGRQGVDFPEDMQFVRIEDQKMTVNGEEKTVDPQYLPKNVFQAYVALIRAMHDATGKKLLVESGYRSPAYQLYQFMFFTPKHHYSLVETGHWVAIPGYSEHGAPHQQAIDFVNEEGVNGEDDVEAFEALPEYQWLQEHAAGFGFELSYPRGKEGITFEPWHWSYRNTVKENTSP